jgi:hypothetical protein
MKPVKFPKDMTIMEVRARTNQSSHVVHLAVRKVVPVS